jgi:hypothetical protein
VERSSEHDGPPRKGPKHVVDFFDNLKIQLLRRSYTHLISTSIGSHKGDDATKDNNGTFCCIECHEQLDSEVETKDK